MFGRIVSAALVAAALASPAAQAAECGGSVVVRTGDTLAGIARRCDVSLDALRRANPDLQRFGLSVGDRVVIPEAQAAADVTVSPRSGKPGDTVTVVATGFRPNERVVVSIAPLSDAEADLRRIGQARADATGRVVAEVTVPRDAAGRVRFVATAPDGTIMARSRPFEVTSQSAAAQSGAGDRVAFTGVVTREGDRCHTVRAEDGSVYTVPSGAAQLRAGDVVRIDGRIAERDTCGQGNTLSIASIRKTGNEAAQTPTLEDAVRSGAEALGQALRNR